MNIRTNISSLHARQSLSSANSSLTNVMQRLSSGLRINSASDDAAGLAISSRMKSYTNGVSQAARNAQDGLSMLSLAEQAQGSVQDMLQRMRELAVQANNGVYSTQDKQNLQAEYSELLTEIDRLADSTSYNNIDLLNSDQDITLHVGEKSGDTMTISFVDVRVNALQINGTDISTDATDAIDKIDTALDTVSSKRASLGASMSRLEYLTNNLNTYKINIDKSLSRIQDADMASEASNLAKLTILSQTSMAMLTTANTQPSAILSLLRG